MKEWKCVKLDITTTVAQVIEERERNGWRLHSYNTAGMGGSLNYTVNHYLLFVKGE